MNLNDFDICVIKDVYSTMELVIDKTEAMKAHRTATNLRTKLIKMCDIIHVPKQYQQRFFNHPEQMDIVFLVNLIEDATK